VDRTAERARQCRAVTQLVGCLGRGAADDRTEDLQRVVDVEIDDLR
jgi:hypothetical protein